MVHVQNVSMHALHLSMVSANLSSVGGSLSNRDFVVPRPLIVEEHGLRVLMENQGVGVLLSQESYENGDWANKIEEAYEKGKYVKSIKRKMGWDDTRKREADQLAKDLVAWLTEWHSGVETLSSESAEAVPETLAVPVLETFTGGTPIAV
jgi:hypothetical protein